MDDRPATSARSSASRGQRRKRGCVTTACEPCRKRKTRCDGTLPICYTCRSYKTECVYDLNSDGRRRPSGAQVSALESRVKFLESLVQHLRQGKEDEYQAFLSRNGSLADDLHESPVTKTPAEPLLMSSLSDPFPILEHVATEKDEPDGQHPSNLLDEISQVMSQLNIDETGEVHYFGPSSNLNLVPDPRMPNIRHDYRPDSFSSSLGGVPALSDGGQSFVLDGPLDDIGGDHYWGALEGNYAVGSAAVHEYDEHLLNIFWTWQHPFFFLVSKKLFLRDLQIARERPSHPTRTKYYSEFLLYAIYAHAAHLSRRPEVRSSGEQYFAKARKLVDPECESPSLATIQALALMGSREAGCGRDTGLGWLYSGMSFRMALDMGLHLSCDELVREGRMSQDEADARSLTYWGIYAYDKAWSAYLGKPESIPANLVKNVSWPAQDPEEELAVWTPYYEDETENSAVTREPMVAYSLTTARQIVLIQEILGSIVRDLYPATPQGWSLSYSDIVTKHHCQLLTWLRELPSPLRVHNHGHSALHLLPHVILMHMLYHTATILLFRPFISHSRARFLPKTVDPLGACTDSAVKIVTLTKAHGKNFSLANSLNMAVHAVFTASTIHLINSASTSLTHQQQGGGYNARAAHHLARCMDHLRAMGGTWPSAWRCLHVIRSLMAKYGIAAAPADLEGGITGGVPSTNTNPAPTVPLADEEPSPKDYTQEARRRQQPQRVDGDDGSPPMMPQLLPQPTFVPQAQFQPFHDPDADAASFGLPPEQMVAPGMDTAAADAGPAYIQTSFDVSFFENLDMQASLWGMALPGAGDWFPPGEDGDAL